MNSKEFSLSFRLIFIGLILVLIGFIGMNSELFLGEITTVGRRDSECQKIFSDFSKGILKSDTSPSECAKSFSSPTLREGIAANESLCRLLNTLSLRGELESTLRAFGISQNLAVQCKRRFPEVWQR